jgi:hypothetical protein
MPAKLLGNRLGQAARNQLGVKMRPAREDRAEGATAFVGIRSRTCNWSCVKNVGRSRRPLLRAHLQGRPREGSPREVSE